MRHIPAHTLLTDDVISIEMRVPSGQLGIREHGQRVIVRIDRSLGVEVREAVFGERVIVDGAWNLTAVVWDLPHEVIEWELCPTALEMIDAQVKATIKLFRRYWLNASWLDARAQLEVLS